MSESKRLEGLEIDQDLRIQQRTWALQRFGWGVITVIIISALLGLLGSGPLASRVFDSSQQGFRLEYQRFLRQRAPTRLRLLLKPKSNSKDEVQVWYDRALVEHFVVTHVVPWPIRVEIGAERLTYTFRVTDQEKPFLITFFLEPETFGSLSGRVGTEDNDSLFLRQFVYP